MTNESEEAFLRDYRGLPQEYKEKAWKYLKKLLELQRAENELDGKVKGLEGTPYSCSGQWGIRCNFCGRRQEDVARLIAGAGVCICEQCVALCSSILEKPEMRQ